MKTKPSDADRKPYRLIGHRSGELCPCCRKASFCDDCGLCESCGFSTPEVDLPHPPPPAPRLRCPECGGTVSHERTCSVTLRALAN